MPNLGSVLGVRRIIGRSSEEVSDTEIEHFLNEADRKIRARNNNKYMVDTFYSTNSTEYPLYFPAKEGTTPDVYVNGVKQVENVNYEYSNSVITFLSQSSIHPNSRVAFFYTPEFFDDYANYLASERIYSVSLLDTNNAVSKGIYDTIKDNVMTYEKMCLRPYVAGYVEHKEDWNDIY
jgi:hypothetical protein